MSFHSDSECYGCDRCLCCQGCKCPPSKDEAAIEKEEDEKKHLHRIEVERWRDLRRRFKPREGEIIAPMGTLGTSIKGVTND